MVELLPHCFTCRQIFHETMLINNVCSRCRPSICTSCGLEHINVHLQDNICLTCKNRDLEIANLQLTCMCGNKFDSIDELMDSDSTNCCQFLLIDLVKKVQQLDTTLKNTIAAYASLAVKFNS